MQSMVIAAVVALVALVLLKNKGGGGGAGGVQVSGAPMVAGNARATLAAALSDEGAGRSTFAPAGAAPAPAKKKPKKKKGFLGKLGDGIKAGAKAVGAAAKVARIATGGV